MPHCDHFPVRFICNHRTIIHDMEIVSFRVWASWAYDGLPFVLIQAVLMQHAEVILEIYGAIHDAVQEFLDLDVPDDWVRLGDEVVILVSVQAQESGGKQLSVSATRHNNLIMNLTISTWSSLSVATAHITLLQDQNFGTSFNQIFALIVKLTCKLFSNFFHGGHFEIIEK